MADNKEKTFDESQKNAINILKNAVVSAGAGSGKTTVLSERFLKLVQQNHYNVEEILTLTFTKKATVEMSSRIYKVLKQKAPEQAANFYKSNIKTLDSYCSSVAKMGARFYGITPDFTQDDSINTRIKQLALPFILKNRDNEAIKLLVNASDFDEKTSEIFVEPILENSTVAEPIDFESSIKKQVDMILTAWKKLVSSLEEAISEFENAFFDFTGNRKSSYYTTISEFLEKNPRPEIPELLKEDLENANEEKFYECSNFISGIAKIRQPGTLGGAELLKAAQKQLRDLNDFLTSILNYIQSYSLMQKLVPLLKEFQNLANDLKRSTGCLTFKDISNLALCTLRDHPEIRKIEKQKYKAIMIDEFQDNNSEQRDLLFLLAENPNRMEKGIPSVEELCPEKLFFVGDEKQSIYRFRGADVSVFRSLSKDFKDGNLSMATNYRSKPALIAAFNTIFGGFPYPTSSFENENKFVPPCVFFTERNKNLEVPDYEAVYKEVTMSKNAVDTIKQFSEKEVFSPKIHFALYDCEKNKEYSENINFITEEDAEAEWVALKIKELIQNGHNPNEIAILFRNYTLQPLYERTFLKHSIPYNTEVATGFFDDGPVNDIISFLRLCAYPEDTQPYAQLLRSPMCNLSIKEVNAILSFDEKPFSSDYSELLDESSLNRYLHLKQIFENLEKNKNILPLTKLVSEIWYNFGYRYETLWNPTVSMYSKMYDLIFELARKAELLNLSLASFVDFAEKYKGKASYNLKKNSSIDSNVEKVEGMDIPLEHSSGVHILTIHKSKGLEYDTVFICGTHKKGKNDTNSKVLYCSKEYGITVNNPEDKSKNYFYQLVDERNKKMQAAELRRLVYVALTRARKEIFITNGKYKPSASSADYLPGKEKNPSTIFNVLEPVYDYYINQEQKNILPFDKIEISAFEKNNDSCKENIKNTAEAKVEFIKLLENSNLLENAQEIKSLNAENKYILPSKLHQNTYPQTEDKENIEDEKNVPFPEINEIFKKHTRFTRENFGTIAHAYLESAVNNLKKPEYSLKEIQGLDEDSEALKIIDSVCLKMQKTFIESEIGQNVLNSEWKKTEFSFRFKDENKIISGIMDLVFKNKNGTYTIVDYKTNSSIHPESFKEQLSCYKNALSAMLSIKNSDDIKCFIYYLRFGKLVEIIF